MQTRNAHAPALPDQLPELLRALIGPALAAGIGGAATSSSVSSWYPRLEKPGFTPPSWVFGPAWTTLYLMMGVADFIVSQRGDGQNSTNARTIYRIQLGLNTLWSIVFFGMRSPLGGLVEIVFLWVAILMTVIAFWRVSKLAAILLVPYLAWTTFAAALNASIWFRNR